MDVEPVRVEGYYEVLTLHRMLMECKSDDLGSVYAGSPFIAAIQHRLADALEVADPGHGWHDWRSADAHPHRVGAVRAHLAQAGESWQDLGEEQRVAYVRNLLAPLRPSQELLAELTATDDSNGAGRADAVANDQSAGTSRCRPFWTDPDSGAEAMDQVVGRGRQQPSSSPQETGP